MAYKITVPIYDYTAQFCIRHVRMYSRTRDQMEQAARSGMQNIAEGSKQQSLKGYIKLAGVSRGSLEELLNDYKAFARQHGLVIYTAERAKLEIGEIREIWEIINKNPTLPDNPNFPALPKDLTKTVNLLITIISQANMLIDRLVVSLKEKHRTEGGFSEKLYQTRKKYRGF